MRCSRLLAVAAAAVLAFAAPAVAQDSICAKYANVLTVPQVDLMTALINRVIFGVNNQTSTFGSRGTFVGLRSDANTLDVVSTTNFGASSGSISLTGANGNVIGLARRPNGGNFSFIDTNGQTYTADVDSAIRSGVSTVVLVAQTGAAVAARATGGNIGFDFNPVGDALRITNGNNNFRLNANTGAAGAGATADGTDSGNPFSYDPATAPAGAATPLIVATAYTNQVSPSPRNATITFGTTQYGIDQANKRFVTISVPNAGTIGASNPITVNGNAIPDFTSADITTVPSSGATPPSNTVVATINGILYTINPSSGVATPLGGALNGTSYRSVAFTPAVGNNGIIEPLNAVAGIAGSPNIVGFFNTVRKFKTNQPDWTVPGDAQNTLRSKLVAFFGQAGALGCNAAGFPQYSSSQSQYSIHAAMNITQAEFDTFNLQVATAASSFGVSTTDVDSVRSVLSGFGRQPTTGNSNAICTDSGCACAPGFDSANNCQSTSSSSSGGNGTPTNPDNGAAAGLSAPFALVAALALAMAALRA